MRVITSANNRAIREARKLRQRKFRLQHRRFLLEGVRLVESALRAEAMLIQAFATPGFVKGPHASQVLGKLEATGVEVLQIPNEGLRALADTETPQGLVAVAANVVVPATELPVRRKPLLLVLDGVGDPGNVGTLIRAAWSLGAHGVLLGEGCCDPLNPKAVRASMGGLFHVPVAVARSTADITAFARKAGVALIGAAGGRGQPCDRFDLNRPVAIVVGSETAGLSAAMREATAALVCIPEHPGGESLNAAVAGAVLLYEASRQRRAAAPSGPRKRRSRPPQRSSQPSLRGKGAPKGRRPR